MYRCFVSLTLLFAAVLASAQDYYAQFGNEPVPVLNRSVGQTSNNRLFLTGVDRGDLILKTDPTSARSAEVGMPMDAEGLRLQVLFDDRTMEAVRAVTEGQYDEAIGALRPKVYPLIKYLEVPPEKINVHEVVERYLFALVNADGHEEEVNALIRRIPLTQVPPVFSVHALSYVSKLVDQGERSAALRLLNRIPLDAENPTMLALVIDFANSLREQGSFEEALFLYERVQSAEGTEAAQLATLWTAYCNVMLDRQGTAALFVEEAGEFTREQKPYSLAKMVQGKIEIESLDYDDAMEKLAQAVVSADVGYSWTPELTYLVGLCYENLNLPDTAREVYKEVILFYPDSPWSDKAQEATMRLPPPAPKTDEPAS